MDVKNSSEPIGGEANNDQQLIDRTISGDQEAFDCLVSRHAGRLLTMIRHLVGNREDAEDLMQETFAKAYFKLDTFAGKSAFFTWLYRIAFNLSVSKRRKRRIESTHQRTSIDVAPTPVDAGPTVGQRLEGAEQAERLRQAIDQLDEDRRMVLVLRDMDGLDYGEIADLLSIPKGTVRSRLHRARSDLKEIILQDQQ